MKKCLGRCLILVILVGIILLQKANAQTSDVHEMPTDYIKNIPVLFDLPEGSNSFVGTDTGIVTITQRAQHQIGALWSKEEAKLDMNEDFKISTYLYFGNTTAPADGMAFVIHNSPERNQAFTESGTAMGVLAPNIEKAPSDDVAIGIENSFAVEFDTFVNNKGRSDWVPGDGIFDDGIDEHHVAWLLPGNPEYYGTKEVEVGWIIPGLVPARQNKRFVHHQDTQTIFNLTDGTWRGFDVIWEAQTETLSYQLQGLDTVTIQFGQGGIPPAREVFGIDEEAEFRVFWGFTGSTGSRFAEQKLVFREVPFVKMVDVSVNIFHANGEIVKDGGFIGEDEPLMMEISAEYYEGIIDWSIVTIEIKLDEHLSYPAEEIKIFDKNGIELELLEVNFNGEHEIQLLLGDMNMEFSKYSLQIPLIGKLINEEVVTKSEIIVAGEGKSFTFEKLWRLTTNQPPHIEFTSHTNHVKITQENPITISGTWEDVDSDRVHFEFYQDGELLKEMSIDTAEDEERIWSIQTEIFIGAGEWTVKIKDQANNENEVNISYIRKMADLNIKAEEIHQKLYTEEETKVGELVIRIPEKIPVKEEENAFGVRELTNIKYIVIPYDNQDIYFQKEHMEVSEFESIFSNAPEGYLTGDENIEVLIENGILEEESEKYFLPIVLSGNGKIIYLIESEAFVSDGQDKKGETQRTQQVFTLRVDCFYTPINIRQQGRYQNQIAYKPTGVGVQNVDESNVYGVPLDKNKMCIEEATLGYDTVKINALEILRHEEIMEEIGRYWKWQIYIDREIEQALEVQYFLNKNGYESLKEKGYIHSFLYEPVEEYHTTIEGRIYWENENEEVNTRPQEVILHLYKYQRDMEKEGEDVIEETKELVDSFKIDTLESVFTLGAYPGYDYVYRIESYVKCYQMQAVYTFRATELGAYVSEIELTYSLNMYPATIEIIDEEGNKIDSDDFRFILKRETKTGGVYDESGQESEELRVQSVSGRIEIPPQEAGKYVLTEESRADGYNQMYGVQILEITDKEETIEILYLKQTVLPQTGGRGVLAIMGSAFIIGLLAVTLSGQHVDKKEEKRK